ncbi:hypothetical protein Tco_1293996 [Tanacetum coccineum]
MGLDESITSGEVNPAKVLTKRHHDDDQDPLAGFGKENKKERKRKDSKPSKDKDQSSSSSKVHEVAMKADNQAKLKMMWIMVKDTTKDDVALKGTLFGLSKIPNQKLQILTGRRNLKLMMHRNRHRDRCPFDLSKPLPLQDYQGLLIIPVNFFFNNDLEYLKTKAARKRLMRADELYKFCDRTLKSEREVLNDRLHNFVLGYNADMQKRA